MYLYVCCVQIKPTINIWLDNRRIKKDDKYPVKIRITYKRNRYYYPTNISLSEIEFKNALSPKPSRGLKDIHFKLQELERQANVTIDKIVDDMQTEFSIGLFEKYLHINNSDYKDVFNCFQRKIDELNQNNQIKTASGYETSLVSFKLFVGRGGISFPEIDKKFLEDYEKFMLKEKKSYTTIGIYTRNLRTIFNEAIERGDANQNFYPFGHNKYQPPQSANNKRALEAKDLQKILKHKPEENTWEEYAKDIWMFSLLCQGVNMKDIANIRYKNIQADQLVFIREKTKRTKRAEQMPIVVYLGKEALDIIKKWGHENISPNQLVFPIYSDENTPLRNLRLVEQQTKMINKYMRKIATDLKIKQDFTFYAARHSFATVLKRQGRSTEEIQEFLGHASKKTTELYLGSFSDSHKRNVMRDFVKGLKNA